MEQRTAISQQPGGGSDPLLEKAHANAREVVEIARRQADLILADARVRAERIRASAREAEAVGDLIDHVQEQVRVAARQIALTGRASEARLQQLDRRVAAIEGAAAVTPLREVRPATAPAADVEAGPAIALPSRAVLLRVAYWTAVFIIALVVVAAVVLLLASTDLSSLEPA